MVLGDVAFMDELPPLLKERLEAAGATPPTIVDRQLSADGTRKYVLVFADGAQVEAVGMPKGDPTNPDWLTVCFSCQVGCAMGCAFCATGRQGLTRNLEAHEMLWEIVLVGQDFGRLPNAVLAMGQGEPLANHAALIETFKVLCDERGLGIGGLEAMLSTCGLLAGIRALADAPIAVTLNVSLHATTQDLRDKLMPGVSGMPLGQLHDELARYNERTGRQVVLGYLLLDGVNDSEQDLLDLQEFCEGLDAMVVLLRYNSVEGIPFASSSPVTRAFWALSLNRAGIRAVINHSRGFDISAACGQLANRTSHHEA